MTTLPGGLTTEELTRDLRRHLDRPDLVVTTVEVAPLAHVISAPTTSGLHRVVVGTDTGEVVRLVVKGLQAARHGLPPGVPAEVRDHLDRVIPWRREVEVLRTPTMAHLPAGLRAPVVVAVHEQDDDRATLWTEDVAPVDRPWTPADTERAAHLLGRLAARRRDDPQPASPAGDFLTTWCADQLAAYAVPRVLDDATWAHPVFRQPELAALRPAVTTLAADVGALRRVTLEARQLPAHGDPTPMNLLLAPDGALVPIDWGTATQAPVGWDLVPLVFGRAEAGTEEPHGLGATLDSALDAHREGLAEDGVRVDAEELRRAVLAATLLRYPLTCLPLGVTDGAPEDPGQAVWRAAFVRVVLGLSGR